MENLIEEIYYGTLAGERKYFTRGSEIDRLMKIMTETESKLHMVLDETNLPLFTRFSNAQSEVTCMTAKEHYIRGFRTGASLILDILRGVADTQTDVDVEE